MTKPVAWMASNELLFSVVKDEIYHIPLYTQRELTDEEINQIVWQQNLLLGNDDLREFARAILQKASEK
jgi:hypothetical protein